MGVSAMTVSSGAAEIILGGALPGDPLEAHEQRELPLGLCRQVERVAEKRSIDSDTLVVRRTGPPSP